MNEVLSSQRDFSAHRQALQLPAPLLVERLVRLIGRYPTASLAGVKDVRAVDRWMAGRKIYGPAEGRLRLALQAIEIVAAENPATVVSGWLAAPNPLLDDRTPSRIIRDGDPELVAQVILRAARSFGSGANTGGQHPQ